MVIEKEHSLQEAKEECIKLKVDLLEQSKQGKRYVGLWDLQICRTNPVHALQLLYH
jgi:hypothetical protein